MNDKKFQSEGHWFWKICLILGVVFGFVIGIIVYAWWCPVEYVEISAKSGENVLDFYVDYLKAQGYDVINKTLSVNDYTKVDDFKEFLWLMDYGNFTECYIDYGHESSSFLFKTYRASKLWFQLDGTYWELRIDD